MKQLSLLVFLFSITCSIWAQTEENLFEWQDGHNIVVKDKFLELHSDWEQGDTPAYLYKEYDVFSNRKTPYRIQIIGIGNEKMPEGGSYELFAIYHNGKKILEHQADNFFCEIGDITADACKDHLFTQVPLSDDSFPCCSGTAFSETGLRRKWWLPWWPAIRQKWSMTVVRMLTNTRREKISPSNT